MKAFLKFAVGVFIACFVGVIIILFLVMPKDVRDQVNPFIKEENRYFIVEEDGSPYGPTNMERYAYDVKAYNSELEPLIIHVTAIKNLKHGAYIEVLTKGTHVESYQEVTFNQLPPSIQQLLSN